LSSKLSSCLQILFRPSGLQAYADYNDLIKLTEDMVSGMAKEITGSYIVKYVHAGWCEYVIISSKNRCVYRAHCFVT
jgi:hypothetical protein